MPGPSQDDRPPMVIAMQWVNQITAVAIEMVLPAGVGYWLDSRWGTDPWLVICGAILGFGIAMQHLLRLAKMQNKQTDDRKRQSGDNSAKL